VVIASLTASTYTEAGILIGGSVATAKLPDVDCKLPIRHRGPATHSLLACVVFAAAIAVGVTLAGYPGYALLVAGGMGLGVVLHQLADALTISGVPLLWPAVRDDVHLLPAGLRIRTDGSVEALLSFVLLAGLLGFLWMTYGT